MRRLWMAGCFVVLAACTASGPRDDVGSQSPPTVPASSGTVGDAGESPRLDYYVPMIRGLARQVAFADVRRLYIRTDICGGAEDVPFGRNEEPCRDAFTADEQTALATRLRSFAPVVRFVDRQDETAASKGRGDVIVWVGPADRRHGDVFIGGGAWAGGTGQGGTYVLKSRNDGWVFSETPSGSFWIT